jgi:hypothetical protein
MCSNRDENTFFMTNENKKTSDQLIFVHIFRKTHFKTNLEYFMSESLNATSTPLRGRYRILYFDIRLKRDGIILLICGNSAPR